MYSYNYKDITYLIINRLERILSGRMNYEHGLLDKVPHKDYLRVTGSKNILITVNIDYAEDAINVYKIKGDHIKLDEEGKLVLCCKEKNIKKYGVNTQWFLFVDPNIMYYESVTIKKLEEIEEKYIETSNIEDISKAFEEHTINNLANKIQEQKERYEAIKRELNMYVARVEEWNEKSKNCLKKIKELSEQEINTKSLEKEIENIANHKLVARVTYNNLTNQLKIRTETIYMSHPYEDDRRLLGKMEIKIKLDNYNVNFFNLGNRRKSYWGDNCNHPHVGQDGYACLGNLDGMLIECKETNNLYAAFLLAVNFLQTFEPDDPAGEYYVCWDKVDENGEIIEEGQCDKYDYYCEDCGRGMWDDEQYYCEECQRYFCEDCIKYVDDVYLCISCTEEVATMCSNCGDLHYNEEMRIDYRGERVCERCIDDNYVNCVDCDEYVHEDLAVWDAVDEVYRCPNCAPVGREE